MPSRALSLILGIIVVLLVAYFFWNHPQGKIDISPEATSTPGPATSTLPLSTSTPPPVNNPPVNDPPATSTPPAPTSTPVVVPREIVFGDTSKRQVVFSFDGGAGNQSIDEILAVLDKHGLKSTLFVTGRWAEQNPASMRAIAAKGHEIWNHTYSHPDLTTISESQIRSEFRRTEDIIKNLTGRTSQPYFRPPYGARNSRVLRVAAEEGYRSVYWSTDAWDWKEGITDAEVQARIMNGLRPGAIYLMHIGDDITGRILDGVFTEIKSQGYIILPLRQAL